MLKVNIDEKFGIGSLSIGDEELIWDIQPILYINGVELALSRITKPKITHFYGKDNVGKHEGWNFKWYLVDRRLVETKIKYYPRSNVVIFEMESLRKLKGTKLKDSFLFTTYNFPAFRISNYAEVLYYTWGLTKSGDFPGGFWPEGHVGEGIDAVPDNVPFTPFVVKGKNGALAFSAFNMFLVSPMRKKGNYIMRGVHGSINVIRRGFVTKTIAVYGNSFIDAINRWGSLLLKVYGKKPIKPMSHDVLKKLGYWNSYGGYYSELFHPMNEEIIRNVCATFKKMEVPLGYIGLDLWYIFDKIGLAKEYKPNPQRFSKSLGMISNEVQVPFVLHLSAFDKENYYTNKYHFIGGKNEIASVPIDAKFYDDLANIFVSEGGIAVWYDWIRTYQSLIKELRSNPEIAEYWFDTMIKSFDNKGLAVILCMPTIGFILSSVKHQNIISLRTYNDYLLSHKGQLKLLRKVKGWRWKIIPKNIYIKQNFMVGLLAKSLGMMPFFDVFITNPRHPEGFAEPNAKYEALMRILSGGIVGIGDRVDHINRSVLKLLLTPDGNLAKPDEPAIIWERALNDDLLLVHTYSKIGKYYWKYVGIINTGQEEQSYNFDLEKVFKEKICFIYDYFKKYVINGSTITGDLKPCQVDYYIIPPTINDITPVGFIDNFVTMPSYTIQSLRKEKNNIVINVKVVSMKPRRIALFPENVKVKNIYGGVILRQNVQNNIRIITFKPISNLTAIKFYH
ncbi:MAG: hypothetical protein ACP5OK_03790 [Thermoprotei archaeon]